MLRTICTVLGALAAGSALAQAPAQNHAGGAVQSGTSYQNDTSLPLYYLPAWQGDKNGTGEAREAAENPRIPNRHVDSRDPVVQNTMSRTRQMPAPIMNFDGVDATGSACGCLPPDTDGQVGDTQYLQMVNMAFQVFDKTTGASLAGPTQISAAWAGFGGACENGGFGDPIVLYDQLANRWLISQFASATGGTPITDECIAVSVTSDATGAYHRYGFHLSSNFIDYPHLGMWPDAYYMSTNVFNAGGTAYLGPQPWAFDRAAMLAGTPATFVTTGVISSNDAPILPANLDGQTLPALGAPEPFVEFPGNSPATYQVFHFHPDFVTPANTTFTLDPVSPAAAGFTQACTGGRSCVPEVGGEGLDGIGDRLMFRLAYRNFGDHEALVGNYTVSANSATGVRWFELRNVTSGTPSVFQEGTYAPDTDWRWMGSTAMDTVGNIAVGYSASSATIHPQLRYAGRLAGDPVGTLPQAEVHLFDGPGSQNSGSSRWGDYSDLTVDPVDDCTFWYTNEYVDATGGWKTRIGSFKFPNCSLTPGFTLSTTPAAASACAGTPATFTVNVGSTAGFQSPVTLAASGNPPPSTATLVPLVVPTLPGSSLLTIGNTATIAAGVYPITVNGTATGASPQSAIANLSVFAAVPGAPTLTAPANAAVNQPARPTFSWTGSNTETYTIDVATDAGFTNIVFTQSVTGTTVVSNVDLVSNTQFFWRVTPANACGNGTASPTFTFTTAPLPGDCSAGTTAQTVYSYGFESGLNGWTLGAGSIGNTWADNTVSFHSGAHSWAAIEPATVSDQRFVSPPIVLPSGQLPLTLQFWTKRSLEPNPPGCYDGGILEASTDAGTTWTQISSASMLTDPYTGLISSSFQNPLGGLQGWCGVQDWHNSIVDIAAYAGQTAQFRYRLGSDSSVPEPGWWLDDVKVQSCSSTTTQHTVTPSAGANGSIAPSTPVQVNDGSTTTFTLTPALGYTSGPVTGTCGGTLAGNVFTTAPVTADCTVDAAFTQVTAGDVGISISDGRAYAQYGKALTYTVTVSNPTLTPISGVSVSDVFPAQLNISQANWTCLGGPGVTCTASGTGALSDSGVVVPAAGSVSYLVTAPVQPDAAGGDVVYTVNVTSAGDPNPANNTASDDDILVLFRSGFDPGNDGGNSPGH